MAAGKKKKAGKKKPAAGKGAQTKKSDKHKGRFTQHPPVEQASKTGPNPYEVFQNNRRRRQILGERVRGARRDVTKSREAAAESRARSLLKDRYLDRRSSKFKDSRLGETEDAVDERKLQRLVKLRQRQAKRSFALEGQEEVLTVKGRALTDLADNELNEAVEEDELDAVGLGKLQKAELAKEKEEHEKLLGKLDTDFGDIMRELSFRPPKAQAPLERKEADDYDRAMKEMAFERRVTATERTKTPEELARERKERLEALERERALRAQGHHDDQLDDQLDQPQEAEAAEAREHGACSVDTDGECDGSDEADEEEDGNADDEVSSGDDADDQVLARSTQSGILSLTSIGAAADLDIMANGIGEESVPYAVECPLGPRAVADLFGPHLPLTVLKLVQRARAFTAAAIDLKNKAKLKAFFLALLEYLLDAIARSDGDVSARGIEILYVLRSVLVEMANEFPMAAQGFFTDRLQQMSPATLPRASEFACLKLISIIFPVTDFQHPVLSPAAALADHWAARLGALGQGLGDLVGDALALLEVHYHFTFVAKRFSVSFLQLGVAILECCLVAAGRGRLACRPAAIDTSALLVTSLRAMAEEDHVAASVAIEAVLQPFLQRAWQEAAWDQTCVSTLTSDITAILEANSLAPLTLFEAPRAQIRSLDPIFHEPGDMSTRGADKSETQLLKAKLSEARRVAARQLRRDASMLQQLESHKETARRAVQATERTRVRKIMEVEAQELKKMKTETDHGMDTSLHKFSKTKDRKKTNPRMAGNMTANPEKP